MDEENKEEGEKELKRKISILAALVLAILLAVPAAVPALADGPYDSQLILENKDAAWQVIESDDIQGVLDYNSSGAEFEYSFTATGVEINTTYLLIYYADKPDRFVDWGGNNPGALIGGFQSDDAGVILSGPRSVDLAMNLPCEPDANISEYDYTDPAVQNPPYLNAHGAKIWLVPADCYTDGSDLKVTTWTPARFLFETDLMTYNDTDIIGTQVGLTTEVLPDLIQISVSPSMVSFGSLLPGASSSVETVTIVNGGTLAVDVTATTASDFYENYLGIDSSSVSSWGTPIAIGANHPTGLQVVLPAGVPSGTQTGTLVFWAEAQ